MTTENASVGGESGVPQQPKKKKRGLWWKALLGLVVLLILLVALAPMIASTGAVRSLVLGKVNGMITGRVEIQDWSLAWFGGQSINGVKVFDEKNRLVLEVSQVKTPATLLALARGNYDLGKTEINDLNLTQMEIGPDGQTNYQRLFMPKAAATTAAPAPAPMEKPAATPAPAPAAKPMPAVKIDLSIKPMRGTIIALGADGKQSAPAIEIRPESEIAAKLADPSQPITDRVKIVLVVGGKPAGTITVDGSATVDMAANKIQAAQKLLIEQLDLGALSPLLALAKVQGQMAGVVSGDLAADIAAADRGTIKGRITGTALEFGGAMLKGDVVRTAKLDIPIDLTLGAGQTLSGTLMVQADQGKVQVDMNLPLEALTRLGAGHAPGAAGQTKVTLEVPDLAVVLNSLKHSLALNEGVAVTGGSLALSANVTLSDKDVKIDVPLKVEGLRATQNGKKIGPLQAITMHLAATAVPVAKGSMGPMEPRDLLVDLTSGFATVHAAGATLETTQLTADCDLAKVKAELGQVFDLSMIRGGTIHVTLANSGSLEAGQTLQPKLAVDARGISLDLPTKKAGERYVVENVGLTLAAAPTIQGKAVTIADASPLTVMLMGRVTHVDGATKQVMWDNESVQVVASGGMSAAGEITGKAQLSLPSVTVKLDQLAASLPTPEMNDLLALVKKFHVTVGVPDLAAAYAMSQRFAPPVAGQPPLNLAGSVSLTADISRVEKTSTFTLAVKADGIAVRRGTTDLRLDKPVTVDVLASAQTHPGADVMAQLAMVRVDKLLGDFGPAKVELTKPIVVSDVAAATKLMSDPKAKAGELGGAIRLTGNFTNIAKLADALAGTKPGQPSVLPMAGDLTSDNEIAYTGSSIALKSKTQILSFAVMQDGKATFSEPQVDLVSNVTLDLATQTLAMQDVSLRLAKSDALSLDVKGSVKDFGGQRTMDGLVITLTPDLAKVWDIVRPLMPPAKQATIGKLVLAGKQPIVVNISGSYPNGKAYADAIKLVKVAGDFRADLIDWQQDGIKLESLAVPFTLTDGVLHTVYQTAQGTKVAPPAKLNAGKLNIPDCKIELTGDHPRLTIPANWKLVEGMQLNTVMVSMLGEKVMPLFYDPKQASGLVDLTIVKCDRLPVDGFVMSADPANDGTCDILASATNLNIGTSGVQSFYAAIRSSSSSGQNGITGNIRDAKVSIAKGHVQDDMKFTMGNGDVGTHGDLVMATNVFTTFVMDVPTSMVSGWLKSPSLLKYMPDRVGLTFHGPASALKLDSSSLTDMVNAAVKKQLTSGILGGGNQPAAGQPATQGGQPAQQKPADTVKDLIDIFGKPKKK